MSVSNGDAAQRQLRRWYIEAREHNVAHAQVATRAQRLQRWSTVIAGVLAVFTGSVWTADLADTGIIPSTVVQWIAAMAAFLSAVILAVTSAANWRQDDKDHTADKRRWGTVDSDIENLSFTDGGLPDPEALAKLRADRQDALSRERDLTPRDFKRAHQWLVANRPQVFGTELPRIEPDVEPATTPCVVISDEHGTEVSVHLVKL